MFQRHLSEVDLVEYADGETELSRIAAIESHLRHCPQCHAAAARARTASMAVLPSVLAPVKVRDRVAAVLAEASFALTCRRALPMLHEYVDHRLSALARVPLARHLETCAHCRKELASLEQMTRLIRSLPLAESPTLALREALAVARTSNHRVARPLVWKPVFAGAVAVLVIGAISALKLPDQLEPIQPVRQVASQPPLLAPATAEVNELVASRIQEPVSPTPTTTVTPPPTTVAEVVAARESRRTRKAPVVRLASLNYTRGPAPEPTVPQPPVAIGAMPSALRALHTVKESVSGASEVRRSMEIAAERYATLSMEVASQTAFASLGGSSANDRTGIESSSPASSTSDRESVPSRSGLEGARGEMLPVV